MAGITRSYTDLVLCGKKKIGFFIQGSYNTNATFFPMVRTFYDQYICPHPKCIGICITGSPTVFTNLLPSARMNDITIDCHKKTGQVLTGSPNVLTP